MTRTRFAWTPEHDQQIAKMMRAGMSRSQIAKEFGLGEGAIAGRIERTPWLHELRKRVPRQKSGPRANREAKPVAPPKPVLRVVNNVPGMVADFIAKHGVRRFEQGATGDFDGIRRFLEAHGYTVSGWQGKYRIGQGKGRPKVYHWRDVVKLADKVRRANGLQPIIREVAA